MGQRVRDRRKDRVGLGQPTRPIFAAGHLALVGLHHRDERSEEHTSELQSLMRISYAVFCLKKKNKHITSLYAFTIRARIIYIHHLHKKQPHILPAFFPILTLLMSAQDRVYNA